tara:strand:+ start:318 stop:515 length:198 start_codon:yes stop_codon:yes gene_type:complete
MLMGINFSEDEVFPGDLVKILNQLESELYGVCIDVNYKARNYPYLIRLTNGHTVRFSEWDLEKVA